NMVIDAVVRTLSGGTRQFDKDGAWAAQGSVDPKVLSRLLDNPYFDKTPPKTTGREQFGDRYAAEVIRLANRSGLSDFDLVATITALTAESIVTSYERWILPSGRLGTVILGGGGARNKTLMRMLEERLSPARITSHAEFGISDDAKEAMAFAVL